MGMVLNSQLANGTDEIDVIQSREFINSIRSERGFSEREWMEKSWDERTEIIQNEIDERGWTYYGAPDFHSAPDGEAFNYKTAIEQAQEEGADTVVVECLS